MRRFALWMALAVLSGCMADDPRCAQLPGGARYCLQTTENIAPFDVQQKIDVAFNERQEAMIAQLEIDAVGMRFVGMTPLGQTLVRASFDNDEIRADGVALKSLDPVLLLALIQLASWDAGQVRAGLGGSAELEESEGQRSLVKDGKAVVRIGYTRGRPPSGDMSIGLPGMGVEFRIVTLDESDAK